MAAALVARSIGPYLRGEVTPRPQPDDGVTVTRPLERDDGRLDATLPAELLERQVRALRPWPGSFLELAGGRLAVLRAARRGRRAGGRPGHARRRRRRPRPRDGERPARASSRSGPPAVAAMDGAAYRRGTPRGRRVAGTMRRPR